MLLDEGLRHADERFRLRAEEAGGLDLRLEFRRRRPRERARVRVALKERGGDAIHPLVRALRRENRRDEQLVGRLEVQLGVGVGVLSLERRHDPARFRRGLGRLGGFCGPFRHKVILSLSVPRPSSLVLSPLS